MDLELIPSIPAPPARGSVWKRIAQRLLDRGKASLAFDNAVWKAAIAGVWLICNAVLIIAALGMPTGLGILVDCAIAVMLCTILMGAASLVIAYILALCYIPIPRLTAGASLFTGYVIWYICNKTDLGDPLTLILAASITGIGLIGGLVMGLLLHRRVHVAVKLTLIAAVAASVISFRYWPINEPDAVPASTGETVVEEAQIPALLADDPAEPGLYRVKNFTYGSGDDSRRDEYGKDAALISEPVDASAYISRWKWLRSLFWGFDENALPINGRVWMPEGDGKFPLVLMVHGNHLMEQFSDEGYEYLGELLASRGFIAVSVDENFLNYSYWGNIPNNDMKVRAWMLLKHLQQIAKYNEQAGTPFYHAVDLQQVALIGHSRGGQAVAMAADPSKWFANDKSLASLNSDGVKIQAVIAIAPTDNVVDKTQAQLKDTYYLSLQGASDGDVDTFNGERQYIRSTFSAGSDRFKSTLYIGEANHSRFNTEWGTMDDSLPGGLFLRRAGMMDADDQREVAKVYVSAFLEDALLGKKEYTPLFADYRTGAAWLPQATYMNRYEDGSFLPLARSEEDYDKATENSGVTASADKLLWTEEAAKDRDGKDKGTRGAVLQWKQGDGSYTLKLPETMTAKLEQQDASASAAAPAAKQLTFAMTNLSKDLAVDANGAAAPLPNIDVELTSSNGAAVRLPLAQFKAVQPLPYTTFTRFPWTEKTIKDGKYKVPSEAVFQTFSLPFAQFQAKNADFNPSELTRVTFYFISDRGKVMLDDIGISTVISAAAQT
ncbi:chlorophyllase-like protein [Paenibacillus taihuensis]|uniref:Chlorophyllase-like protein n=1 Tax=Paenibacillus taihuensis TaxID=1156355 RepID=A0A3D9RU34_9BACL|nr:alpha/beta hydrolase [Paenibacillus taihuensis]REE80222.1 chlorophyllase-like protein [Paenibacillus taihuensis]